MYQLCNDILNDGFMSLQSPAVGDMSTQGMSAGKSAVSTCLNNPSSLSRDTTLLFSSPDFYYLRHALVPNYLYCPKSLL